MKYNYTIVLLNYEGEVDAFERTNSSFLPEIDDKLVYRSMIYKVTERRIDLENDAIAFVAELWMDLIDDGRLST